MRTRILTLVPEQPKGTPMNRQIGIPKTPKGPGPPAMGSRGPAAQGPLKIHLRVQKGLKFTLAQRAGAEQRLGLALGRFGDRVGRVVGRLWDEGLDGQDVIACRVEVDLHPRKVMVEDADTDPLVAIGRAAARASRTVARALERERALEARI